MQLGSVASCSGEDQVVHSVLPSPRAPGLATQPASPPHPASLLALPTLLPHGAPSPPSRPTREEGKGITVRTHSSSGENLGSSNPTSAQAHTPPRSPASSLPALCWPEPFLRPPRAVDTPAQSRPPWGNPCPCKDYGAVAPPCGRRRDVALGWVVCPVVTSSG